MRSISKIFWLACLGLWFGSLDSRGAQSGEIPRLTHGVASGDVSSTSAILWARADADATLHSEHSLDPDFKSTRRRPSVRVTRSTDFTGQIRIGRLRPGARYYYRIQARNAAGSSPWVSGSFTTAPEAGLSDDVCFLWGGDLGGQGYCRKPDRGYVILDAMRQLRPDFVLFSGDMVYADSRCPSPPNLPGSDFVAKTIDEFRQRWKYNREDRHHLEFLAETSMVTQWDDHEVANDFAGPSDALMPLGLQAFFEYHPIARAGRDRSRMYRRLAWGRALELFVLDNRQYRDPNAQPDSQSKSMLGKRQLDWLLRSLQDSKAVWKIVATSVPLTVPTGSDASKKGRDGWANGSTAARPEGDPTGWEREMWSIFDFIRKRAIRNVVWVTTDVHFAQIAKLDPYGDGNEVSYEFISGPLSAIMIRPPQLDTSLRPERLYAEGDFFNFGRICVERDTHRLTVEIRGEDSPGKPAIRFSLTLDPN